MPLLLKRRKKFGSLCVLKKKHKEKSNFGMADKIVSEYEHCLNGKMYGAKLQIFGRF